MDAVLQLHGKEFGQHGSPAFAYKAASTACPEPLPAEGQAAVSMRLHQRVQAIDCAGFHVDFHVHLTGHIASMKICNRAMG